MSWAWLDICPYHLCIQQVQYNRVHHDRSDVDSFRSWPANDCKQPCQGRQGTDHLVMFLFDFLLLPQDPDFCIKGKWALDLPHVKIELISGYRWASGKFRYKSHYCPLAVTGSSDRSLLFISIALQFDTADRSLSKALGKTKADDLPIGLELPSGRNGGYHWYDCTASTQSAGSTEGGIRIQWIQSRLSKVFQIQKHRLLMQPGTMPQTSWGPKFHRTSNIYDWSWPNQSNNLYGAGVYGVEVCIAVINVNFEDGAIARK